MKCDYLLGRKFDGEVYILASDVTEAIAELKEFAEDACLERDDNQTAIDELQAENTELKAKLDKAIAEGDGNQVCIDALKQKIENVQASMYCDVVDANMENRRLRRALWIARAERAEAEHAHWATIWFCNTKIALNINKSSVSNDPYKSNMFRNASEWRNMWYDIASKCQAKAEEYK